MSLKLFPFPSHVEKNYLTRVIHFEALRSVQKVLFIGDTKVGNDLLLTVVIKVAT